MAEAFEVFKRFEYRQNSNLVLQREGPGPAQDEPTGEPESLAGRISYRMGDRVERQTPKDLALQIKERKAKDSLKRARETGLASESGELTLDDVILGGKKRRHVRGNVNDDNETLNAGGRPRYNPSSGLNKLTYQALLEKLMKVLGDVPRDVLYDAASDVIHVCKADSTTDQKRHKAAEQILNAPLKDELFSSILLLARSLTDFDIHIGEDADRTAASTSSGLGLGVAVVFDEAEDRGPGDGDENVEYEDEVAEEEEEIDEGEGEEEAEAEDENNGGTNVVKSMRQKAGPAKLLDIDAYWVQRQLKTRGIISESEDPILVVKKEKTILEILALKDIRECENRLVTFLQYEHFDFVELLMKNRYAVHFLTRLGQAQSAAEEESIRNEMKTSEEGQKVLAAMQDRTQGIDKEKDVSESVHDEATALAVLSATRDREKMSRNKAEEGDSERGILGVIKESDQEMTETEVAHGQDVEMGEPEDEPSAENRLPKAQLDLKSLEFREGSHFMSSDTTKLPDGSKRIETADYDEVIVPPLSKKMVEDSDLVAINSAKFPEWSRPVFTSVGVTHLNFVQSEVFDVAFNQFDQNVLVCAPTGAGKTNIALLTILNLIGQYRLPNGTIDVNQFKVVYVSPMKALVAEQVMAFSKRLECYPEIQVRELTGDMQLSRQQIEETQIIVTTPEKWDVITRRGGERAYTQLVRLMIFDEIHLLHDRRGPVVETLVVRAIRQMEETQRRIRLVGLSATLPNYEDVAIFLRVKLGQGGGLFYFGGHHRPVPLMQTFVGIRSKKATKRFNTMNDVCYDKVMGYAGKSQVLIFVHSRKETAKTARMLRDKAMEAGTLAEFLDPDSSSREILSSEASNASAGELKDLLPCGFGIHHAGMTRNDRKLVEDLFADRHIQVLVSTATLAWGVNLPAHTVIIKGTRVYMPDLGKWAELSPMDVMQMMGRAGRPQYDSSGHGIILTQQSQLQFYLSLNNQQLPVESQLISQLPEVLNSEIVLGTIRSRQEAVRWLGYTYLFVRMLRAPALYQVDISDQDESLSQHRINLVNAAANVLMKHRLVNYDVKSGEIQTTALGRVASHFYIRHETVNILNSHLTSNLSEIELLRVFSLCHEFSLVPVRDEEQLELARLVERVPIPVKGHLGEAASKVNVLLQSYISGLKLEGFALMCDVSLVQQNAPRILRAIFTIALRRGWAHTAKLALSFCKMVDRRQWSSMSPLRQFHSLLGENLMRKIERKEFPWQKVCELTSGELGELMREPSLGKTIHKLIHYVPKIELAAFAEPLSNKLLKLEVTLTPDFQWNPKIHSSSELFWIFIENVDGDKLLHFEEFVLTKNKMQTDLTVTFTVPILHPVNPCYFLRVISDRWICPDCCLTISFKDLILPSKNPPHTELLNLHLLPISALAFPEVVAVYSEKPDFKSSKCFNPIQTQVFRTLNGSDSNCLVCGPAGCGLTTCGEFAIFRCLKQAAAGGPPAKIVVMFGHAETARNKFEYWDNTYSSLLNLQISKTSGDSNTDYKLFNRSDLLITTPADWEALTRRWRSRKGLHRLSLFIAFDLQLLGTMPEAEVAISRLKYMTASLSMKTRIVGFGASIANARDLGDWLGIAKPNMIFSFPATARPLQLDFSIHRFDLSHRETRLVSMQRPLQFILDQKAVKGRNAIIFVPDRIQTRIVAAEILLQTASQNQAARFRKIPENEMRNIIRNTGLKQLREKILEDILPMGVGILHEGMRQIEIDLVVKLFQEDCIQILLMTGQLTWQLSFLAAHLVVIMDTEIWDMVKKRWTHYPVSEVLHMLGHAGRPSLDDSIGSHAVLMCHAAKREEYKQFIYSAPPLESSIDIQLVDHLLPEIVVGTVKNKQEAIDWLTWTFLFRRLGKNPNFYGLKGISAEHVSDHLSDLVESTCEVLAESKCIAVGEDEVSLSALNLGHIACFYSLSCATVESFSRLAVKSVPRRLLLEIMTTAAELESLVPIRSSEEIVLQSLYSRLSLSLSSAATPDFTSTQVKAFIILSAHFRREPLSVDLQTDLAAILPTSLRLVRGLVDVLASSGWLAPVLAAMQLAQMIVQAMEPSDSPLRQLPHFSRKHVDMLREHGIEDIFNLLDAFSEDETREKILAQLHFSENQVNEIATACNRYPVMSVTYTFNEVASEKGTFSLSRGSKTAVLNVSIDRDADDEDLNALVIAQYYPVDKVPEWWLVVGAVESKTVLVIRKTALNKKEMSISLDFDIDQLQSSLKDNEDLKLQLFVIPDSYLGCDQVYDFTISWMKGGE